MRPHTGFGVLAFVLLAPASVLPQQPPNNDTTKVFIAPPPMQIREATVLALMADTLLPPMAQQFAAVRMVAESLGFTFTTVLIGQRQLVDIRYHAVYYLPSDVRSGFFIIIPGHRPDIVRGFVEPDSLRKRLTRYRALSGPLGVR